MKVKKNRIGPRGESVMEKIELKTKLIYTHDDKTIDMSRLKCTDFKYNKRCMLPGPQSPREEALHQAQVGIKDPYFLHIYVSIVPILRNL